MSRGTSPKIIGDNWVANETIVEVLSKRYCLLDVMDLDTRFLLVTVYLIEPEERDIKSLVKSAIDKPGKKPKSLLLLARDGCLDRLKLNRDADFKGIKITPAKGEEASGLAKRHFSSFVNRTRLISRLRKEGTIPKIVNGWLYHYNFRRVHESLSGKSPAEKSFGL